MELRRLSKRLKVAASLLQRVRRIIRRDPTEADKCERKKKLLKVCIISTVGKMREILRITVPIPERRIREERRSTPFDFDRETFSINFRWRSPEDILELIKYLRVPDHVKVHTYRFTAAEVVLMSLARVS